MDWIPRQINLAVHKGSCSITKQGSRISVLTGAEVLLREFDTDADVVKSAIQTITSVLGAPDPGFTKKVVRWERPFISVNLFREARKRACICVAGVNVVESGEIDWALDARPLHRDPPKNSNCSRRIKLGPTLWLYANTPDHFDKTKALLSQLCERMSSVEEFEQFSEEFEADDTDDEPLILEDGERRLATQSLDLSIDALVSRIDRSTLILQPEFQRDYVWTSGKASQLVESVLLRIPLPIVYLSETEDSDWEVVDGQQRLTSLYSFVRGQFPDGAVFRLGKLHVRDDLRGKAFRDLPRTDQNALLNYTLRAIILNKESHPDLKFEVFERLNCGSVQLKDAELRNCMYRGPYNDMLAELSENDFLLKIRRAERPHKRMDDRQLILRFLAMKRNSHLNYRGAMKQFMNREMETHRHASATEIAAMKRQFEEAIECAWLVFGQNAFRRWTPARQAGEEATWDSKLNVALWDTLLYGFAFYEKRQIVPAADAIREEFLDLMASDPVFVDYIGRTTDKPDRVQYRARSWLDRLEKVINTPVGETRAFSRRLKEGLYAADPTCSICGQRIPTADDAEVDHVLHYWRGGATIPENARLTHRYCNRVRGGRN